MSRAVWKYPIPIEIDIALEMPEGAIVLAVQNQHGNGQLWALVDPEAPKEVRTFSVVGTGHPHDWLADAAYVGTFQGGPFVWHLFEVQKP